MCIYTYLHIPVHTHICSSLSGAAEEGGGSRSELAGLGWVTRWLGHSIYRSHASGSGEVRPTFDLFCNNCRDNIYIYIYVQYYVANTCKDETYR